VSTVLDSRPSTPAGRGLPQICVAGVLWGTGGLVVQLIRDRVPMSAVTVSAYRMVLAAVVLFVVVLLLGRAASLRALFRVQPARALVVGAMTASYQTLYFGSVVTVGVSVATVVTLGLAPVLLALADAVRAHRVPRLQRILVLAAATGGLVLVTVAGGHGASGPRPVLGLALAAASGTAFAVATDVGAPLAERTDPVTLAATTTGIGALVLLPVGLALGVHGGSLVTGDGIALALLAYLGVGTMALAYGLLYAGLRTTPSSSAVVATLVEPVTAAVVAAVVLDERLGVSGILGTGLILAAIAGLREPAVVRTPLDRGYGRPG
jgi:drug/metabolite transporter, DME family